VQFGFVATYGLQFKDNLTLVNRRLGDDSTTRKDRGGFLFGASNNQVDDFQRYAYGVESGVGIEYRSLHATLGFASHLGFSPSINSGQFTLRNNSLSFLVGYKF
jgi:hypothetical protein